MKKTLLLLLILSTYLSGFCQDTKSLFDRDTEITWLGIDFSHVKIIGEFSHYFIAESKGAIEIRDMYFPAWNYLVQGERNKYDFRPMLRKRDVFYNIDMIMSVNEKTNIDSLKAHSSPRYSTTEIENFVSKYDFSSIRNKDGIGILFIAEALDKYSVEAYFHFVAVNMKTGEILLQDRLRGEPHGFGIRNYWAGAFYDVMKLIEDRYYGRWRDKVL
ncbi:MAG: hypothetical protein OEW67_01425 [Cyclobacteriaceae bacterium]|nr:hypothetical protein [Cyclobacteriaceae bacterium]